MDPWVALAAKDPFDSPGSLAAHSREEVAHILEADTAEGHNPAADTHGDSPVADNPEALPAEDSHNPEEACIPEGSLVVDSPAADKGNFGGSPVADILEALARVAQIL